jgi:hypothetical protein
LFNNESVLFFLTLQRSLLDWKDILLLILFLQGYRTLGAPPEGSKVRTNTPPFCALLKSSSATAEALR